MDVAGTSRQPARDRRPSLERFDTFIYNESLQEAFDLYNEYRKIEHVCLGHVTVPRPIDDEHVAFVKEAKVQIPEGSKYYFSVSAEGPPIGSKLIDDARHLFVDIVSSELLRGEGGNDTEVRISDYYRQQLKDFVSFFVHMEQKSLLVKANAMQFGFKAPVGFETGRMGDKPPRLVFTKFDLIGTPTGLSASEKKARKVAHYKELASAVKKINKNLGLEHLSTAEMMEFVGRLNVADVGDIEKLAIFFSSSDRVHYLNRLWGTMRSARAILYPNRAIEECLNDFEGKCKQYRCLRDLLDKEANDRRLKNIKVLDLYPQRPFTRFEDANQTMYIRVDVMRNCYMHFWRMFLSAQSASLYLVSPAFCSPEELQLVFELALPSHIHDLHSKTST